MFDFHEKRKIKSLFFSTPTIFILLGISFFLATSVYERYQKERETAEKYAERATESAELKAHAATLEAEVAYMQSTRGIEEEIRDRFDVTKEGEQTVIIIDDAYSTTSVSLTEAPRTHTESMYRRFFSRFLFWRD